MSDVKFLERKKKDEDEQFQKSPTLINYPLNSSKKLNLYKKASIKSLFSSGKQDDSIDSSLMTESVKSNEMKKGSLPKSGLSEKKLRKGVVKFAEDPFSPP